MLSRNLLFVWALLPAIVLAQNALAPCRSLYRGEVLFDFNRWTLSLEGQQTLQEAAAHWRDASPGAYFRIEGHTDSIGTLLGNRRLSQRRAQAVAHELQRLGVPPQALQIRGLGEQYPVAENATEEGRRRNRRAEIRLVAPLPTDTLSGRVIDRKTGAPIKATVFVSLSTWRDSLQTGRDGSFRTLLPKDSVVQVEVFAPGYFFNATTHLVGAGEPSLEIPLQPALSGEKMTLQNLLFYGNQAVLLPESEGELVNVLRFMQLNPQARIEIAGHINNPLKAPHQLDEWEWNLSVNRAKLVYDYLLQNGISPERMRYKGYGNTEMLYPSPSASEAQQAQNRRVEIRVQ